MKNLSNMKKIIEDYKTERQVHQLTAKKLKGKKKRQITQKSRLRMYQKRKDASLKV